MIKHRHITIGSNISHYRIGMIEVKGISPHCGDFKINHSNGWVYLKNCVGVPISDDLLRKSGFDKMPLVSWKGNGYDYQPETSKTEQQDYVKNGFIVRYETSFYRKNVEDEFIQETYISVGRIDDWYKKICFESLLDYELKYLHELQNTYLLSKKKELNTI